MAANCITASGKVQLQVQVQAQKHLVCGAHMAKEPMTSLAYPINPAGPGLNCFGFIKVSTKQPESGQNKGGN